MLNPSVKITQKMLNLIAGIDEFKGEWKAIGNLVPERLQHWIDIRRRECEAGSLSPLFVRTFTFFVTSSRD